MKKNDLLLLSSVLSYSYLFYKEAAGVNFLIFSVILITCTAIKNKHVITNRAWLAASTGGILSAICIILYGSALAVMANIISLSLAGSFAIHRRSSLLFSLAYSFFSYVSSVVYIIIGLSKQKKETKHNEPNKFESRLVIYFIPLFICIVFFTVYREANPLFKDLTQKLDFSFITWNLIQFIIFGFILLYGFYNQKYISSLRKFDLKNGDNLYEKNYNSTSPSIQNEVKSGIILFAMLNIMLLVVNILDLNYLLFSRTLPQGVSYSGFLHQSINMLILSILLAIGIILYYFRGSLNFIHENKTLKIIALIWMVQNVILIITGLSKNSFYIGEYALTYKRIGVFVYLTLCLFGLITTCIKIVAAKSNWFLFRKNAWACYCILILCSFINWDREIAKYNLHYAKKPDIGYILSLSASALPELISYTQAGKTNMTEYQQRHLNQKEFYFLDRHLGYGWPSWNIERERIYAAIDEKRQAENLK
ncbi:MAG: DUF4173 domain-containing protein [Cytophagaceae bacterium]